MSEHSLHSAPSFVATYEQQWRAKPTQSVNQSRLCSKSIAKNDNLSSRVFHRRQLSRKRLSSLGTPPPGSNLIVPAPSDSVCSSALQDINFKVGDVELDPPDSNSTSLVLQLRGSGRLDGGARRFHHNRQVGLHLRAEVVESSLAKPKSYEDCVLQELLDDTYANAA